MERRNIMPDMDWKPAFDDVQNELKKIRERKQTNEEWFDGLSTIEKAKALHKLHWEMQNHFDYSPDDEDYVEEYCLYWLKAVHEE